VPHSMPPSGHALAAFGLQERSPRPLDGGQGRAWSAGNLVLKSVDDVVEATWSADVLSQVAEDGFRINRPVRSFTGEWVVAGWSAWERLPGEHDTRDRWTEVLRVGQRLNAALRQVTRPAFLDGRTHAWAEADRVAWGEEPLTVIHDHLRPLAERLTAHLRLDHGPSQVIHGDLTGNILFAPGLPPAVIDFTPYWRPAQFCLAIVAVDAVLWHGAGPRLLDQASGTHRHASLLARAALRRLITSDRLAADRKPPVRAEHLRSTAADYDRVVSHLERRIR
jgi:uncharacterized protein (TIGR02569 family)